MDPTQPPLLTLLQDGLLILCRLREGATCTDPMALTQGIEEVLEAFRLSAASRGKAPEAIQHCCYAFCALADELILRSSLPFRADWARNPLQFRHFGEHLAGEGFFRRLETLRLDPHRNLETLEVFQACLLLGFQGRHLLEDPAHLSQLTLGLDQELEALRRPQSRERLLRLGRPDPRPRRPAWWLPILLLLALPGLYIGLSLHLKHRVAHLGVPPRSLP